MAEEKQIRGWKARQEQARKRRQVTPERLAVWEARKRHRLAQEGVIEPEKVEAQEAKDEAQDEREQIIERLNELGVKFHPNTGTEKLKAKLDDAEKVGESQFPATDS